MEQQALLVHRVQQVQAEMMVRQEQKARQDLPARLAQLVNKV